MRGGPLPGYFQPVELVLPKAPRSATASNGQFDEPQPDKIIVGMLIGSVYRLRVTNIPGQRGIRSLSDGGSHRSALSAGRHGSPLSDLDRVDGRRYARMAIAGKFVTRVVYLEDPTRRCPMPQSRAISQCISKWADGQDPAGSGRSLGPSGGDFAHGRPAARRQRGRTRRSCSARLLFCALRCSRVPAGIPGGGALIVQQVVGKPRFRIRQVAAGGRPDEPLAAAADETLAAVAARTHSRRGNRSDEFRSRCQQSPCNDGRRVLFGHAGAVLDAAPGHRASWRARCGMRRCRRCAAAIAML